MSPTRRTALHLAASGLTVGLAGCSGERTSSNAPQGELVTNYDRTTARTDGEQWLFWWTGTESRSEESLLVRTDDDRTNVDIASEAPSLRSFVDKTDLSTSSLCLFQRSLDACRRFDVYKVSRRPAEVRVHLCQEPRPANVSCRTDDQRTMAIALRLPFGGESVDELQTSTSSQCEDRFGPRRSLASGRGGGDR